MVGHLPKVGFNRSPSSRFRKSRRSRRPNWHRANNRSQKSADGRMPTEAARLRAKDSHLRKNKTVLTRTGLFMEGVGLQRSIRESYVISLNDPGLRFRPFKFTYEDAD